MKYKYKITNKTGNARKRFYHKGKKFVLGPKEFVILDTIPTLPDSKALWTVEKIEDNIKIDKKEYNIKIDKKEKIVEEVLIKDVIKNTSIDIEKEDKTIKLNNK